jgi:hypothetical protein
MQGCHLEPNSAALMPSSTAYNLSLRVLRHLAAGPKMVQYLRLHAYLEPGSAAGCSCRRSDGWFACCNCRMRQYGRLGRQDAPTTSTLEGCSRTVGEKRSAWTMQKANQSSASRKREDCLWFSRKGCRVKLRPGRCQRTVRVLPGVPGRIKACILSCSRAFRNAA